MTRDVLAACADAAGCRAIEHEALSAHRSSLSATRKARRPMPPSDAAGLRAANRRSGARASDASPLPCGGRLSLPLLHPRLLRLRVSWPSVAGAGLRHAALQGHRSACHGRANQGRPVNSTAVVLAPLNRSGTGPTSSRALALIRSRGHPDHQWRCLDGEMIRDATGVSTGSGVQERLWRFIGSDAVRRQYS
jgi:hypothetical protein